MSGDNVTPDGEGWPLRIPEYVFETAAQAASFPAVTASKPWFRAAVESAFMNGHQTGREDAARDVLAHPGPDPSPANPAWWAGYVEARKDSARVARGPQIVAPPAPGAPSRERIAQYIEDAASRKRRDGLLGDMVVAGAWDEAASWIRDDTIWTDGDGEEES